jgi:hypothetical protein
MTTANVRKERAKASDLRLKDFIIDNIAYDENEGALYLRGEKRVRIPIDHDKEGEKRSKVRIMNRELLAAHVVYICKKKEWPTLPIKHINGNPHDFRWDNLKLVNDPTDEDEDMALSMFANNKFLDDLRKHHPNGPPTYAIKSGKPVVFHSYRAGARGYGGSPAGLCADRI